MSEYIYKNEVEYLSFKKRTWEKTYLLVYIMGFQALVVLTIAIVFQVYPLLFALFIVALGLGVNYYIFQKRMRYFLQGIRVTQNYLVHLDLYFKDENQRIQLPIHQFQIRFVRTGGKGRYIKLSFYDHQRLLGFQYDSKQWNHDNLVEVFTQIKEIKNEPLTKQEERMLKKGNLFF